MSSMTDAYPRLLAALDEVRGQWRTQKILEGVLLTVGGALAVVAALVAVDNLLHPGPTGRLLLATVLWGGLIAAVLSLVVKRVLEDYRDDYFAALVEARFPELRNAAPQCAATGTRPHPRLLPPADRRHRPRRRSGGWSTPSCARRLTGGRRTGRR
ncbi:MAG: hypothetical protein U0736_28495 [Gemmataceae bacterium]